jgi:hypothetical protein
MTSYINWTNLDAGFRRPYEPGDRMVRGWAGDIDLVKTADSLETVADMIYMRHQQDDRPDGQMCPSMSVGDVIQFGEVAYSVARMGFVPVRLRPEDLIVDRTWREMSAEL